MSKIKVDRDDLLAVQQGLDETVAEIRKINAYLGVGALAAVLSKAEATRSTVTAMLNKGE